MKIASGITAAFFSIMLCEIAMGQSGGCPCECDANEALPGSYVYDATVYTPNPSVFDNEEYHEGGETVNTIDAEKIWLASGQSTAEAVVTIDSYHSMLLRYSMYVPGEDTYTTTTKKYKFDGLPEDAPGARYNARYEGIGNARVTGYSTSPGTQGSGSASAHATINGSLTADGSECGPSGNLNVDVQLNGVSGSAQWGVSHSHSGGVEVGASSGVTFSESAGESSEWAFNVIKQYLVNTSKNACIQPGVTQFQVTGANMASVSVGCLALGQFGDGYVLSHAKATTNTNLTISVAVGTMRRCDQ